MNRQLAYFRVMSPRSAYLARRSLGFPLRIGGSGDPAKRRASTPPLSRGNEVRARIAVSNRTVRERLAIRIDRVKVRGRDQRTGRRGPPIRRGAGSGLSAPRLRAIAEQSPRPTVAGVDESRGRRSVKSAPGAYASVLLSTSPRARGNSGRRRRKPWSRRAARQAPGRPRRERSSARGRSGSTSQIRPSASVFHC